MKPKLILGLRLAGRQIAFWVIHQDKSLRGVGGLWQRDELRITSALTPSLSCGGDWIDLFLCGKDGRADRNICVLESKTEGEARRIYNLIREGVAAINAEPDAEPTETSAGFEIVQ